MSQEAACCRDIMGVSGDHFACTTVYISATLRHFDNKVHYPVKYDPLIPCERRLANIEIPEFQEVTSEARFENRDYDRPYRHFSVTLCRFD